MCGWAQRDGLFRARKNPDALLQLPVTPSVATTGFIANTDKDWFDYLLRRSPAPDEVNFWQPSGNTQFRAIVPGSPLFFRLKSPFNAIGGFGRLMAGTVGGASALMRCDIG